MSHKFYEVEEDLGERKDEKKLEENKKEAAKTMISKLDKKYLIWWLQNNLFPIPSRIVLNIKNSWIIGSHKYGKNIWTITVMTPIKYKQFTHKLFYIVKSDILPTKHQFQMNLNKENLLELDDGEMSMKDAVDDLIRFIKKSGIIEFSIEIDFTPPDGFGVAIDNEDHKINDLDVFFPQRQEAHFIGESGEWTMAGSGMYDIPNGSLKYKAICSSKPIGVIAAGKPNEHDFKSIRNFIQRTKLFKNSIKLYPPEEGEEFATITSLKTTLEKEPPKEKECCIM